MSDSSPNLERGQTHSGSGSRYRLLAVASIVPLLVFAALFAAGVPLGKPGTLTYLYSQLAGERLRASFPALLVAAALAGGVLLSADAAPRRRRWGAGLFYYGVICLGFWALTAPPAWRSQNTLNMSSPSHEGAFLLEAGAVARHGVVEYLTRFPLRAAQPPSTMKGTRIVSNPPGTTLLAHALTTFVDQNPAVTVALSRLAVQQAELPADILRLNVLALTFSSVLIVLWGLAAFPLVWLNAEFLPRHAALSVAGCTLVAPMTVLFVPGKDPAQLLTTAACLWLWLSARRWESACRAAAAGAALVLACLVSLVHIWLALIVLLATLWATERRARPNLFWRGILPALAAALLVGVLLRALAGFDFLATARAVAAAQLRVTRGDGAMPLAWQALGIPLFLLFCGPALWFFMLVAARSPRGAAPAPEPAPSADTPRATLDARRFGVGLVVLSTLVMLATVGFTNVETPRLWIPFLPLLLSGAATLAAHCHGRRWCTPSLMAALVVAQVCTAALQWCGMDMREAEMRLIDRPGAGPRLLN
ncbi:MAG: hypothetical protein CHACPFDD_01154 [Phycisphaerae bacterium]|nr:hypothetical protein [Phycisphaerae bacterium]